ncbi:Uncharacterised protein [uncultured archaeon]|nr:Uncharacterised protein [uncultured archaeon]
MFENLTVERKLYNRVGKFKPEKVGNFTPELTISRVLKKAVYEISLLFALPDSAFYQTSILFSGYPQFKEINSFEIWVVCCYVLNTVYVAGGCMNSISR